MESNLSIYRLFWRKETNKTYRFSDVNYATRTEDEQEEFFAPLAMLVMLEAIQQKIIENGEEGRSTWLYVDEVHVLLRSPFSTDYLQQMWKKVRKQGGLCTGITQNIIDVLRSETATTMLSNSAFVLLLNQSNKDIEKITEALEISPEQLNYVIDLPSGTGLLRFGKKIVPFDNTVEKGSELYNLYNTTMYEKMEKRNGNLVIIRI